MFDVLICCVTNERYSGRVTGSYLQSAYTRLEKLGLTLRSHS